MNDKKQSSDDQSKDDAFIEIRSVEYFDKLLGMTLEERSKNIKKSCELSRNNKLSRNKKRSKRTTTKLRMKLNE